MKSWDNGRVWLGIYNFIPTETRPLSHGLTAAFGSIYITISSQRFCVRQFVCTVFVLSSQRFSVRYSDALLIYHKASCCYFAAVLLQRSSSSQCRFCSTHAVIFSHCCSAVKTAFVQPFRCAHCSHFQPLKQHCVNVICFVRVQQLQYCDFIQNISKNHFRNL